MMMDTEKMNKQDMAACDSPESTWKVPEAWKDLRVSQWKCRLPGIISAKLKPRGSQRSEYNQLKD